tara:strand:- start:404 stop:7591 length:7188 start_codon:yes stop_codon:yes gene_type:complete
MRLPDGRTLDLPTQLSEEDRERLLYRLAELYPDDIGKRFYEEQRTPLGSAGTFLSAIPRGAAGTALTAVQGIAGLLTPGRETSFESGIESMQRSDIMNPSPEYRDAWSNKLGSGVGSFLPFLAAGVASGGVGVAMLGAGARSAAHVASRRALAQTAGAMALGSATGAGEQVQRMSVRDDVSTAQEVSAMLAGSLIGTLEGAPVGRVLRNAPAAREAAKAFYGNKAVAGSLAKLPKGLFMGGDDAGRFMAARRALGSALYEGSQEATALALQDLASKVIYNPEQRIAESALDEFLVGGFVGGLADLALSGMAGRQGARAAGQVYQEAKAGIDEEVALKKRLQDATTAHSLAESERRAYGAGGVDQLSLDLQGGTEPLNVGGYTIRPSVTGRGFSIIDNDASGVDEFGVTVNKTIGMPVYETEADAREAVSELQSLDIDLISATKSVLALREQGMHLSPTASTLANRVHHPSSSMFSAPLVANYAPGDPEAGKSRYEAWRTNNEALKDRTSLSAEEVVESIGQEAANVLFFDKARVGSSSYLAISQDINANRLEDGMLPDLGNVDASGDGFLVNLARSLKLTPEDVGLAYGGGASPLNKALSAVLTSKGLVLRDGMANFKLHDPNAPLDPNFMFFSKMVTGTERWADMSDGQKALLISELSKIEESPVKISFPDTRLPEYSTMDRAAVVNLLGEGDLVTVEDVLGGVGKDMSESSILQLFDHLERSGQVRGVGSGKTKGRAIKLGRNPVDVSDRTPIDIGSRISQMSQWLPESGNREEFFRFLKGQFAAVDNAVAEDTEGEEGPKDTPEDKASYVSGTMTALAQVHREYSAKLAKLNPSAKLMDARNAEAQYQLVMDIANGSRDPMKFGAYSGLTGEIALYQSAVDPHGTMTLPELRESTLGTFGHEIWESLEDQQKLTDAEIEAATRASMNVVPVEVNAEANAEGKTWQDVARDNNPGATDEQVAKEARSNMFGAVLDGSLPKRKSAGIVQAAFGNMKDLFNAAFDATGESDLRRAWSVFERVGRGDVGKRAVGRSFLKPDGEIRAPAYAIRNRLSEERSREIKNEIDAISIWERTEDAPEVVFGFGDNAQHVSQKGPDLEWDGPLVDVAMGEESRDYNSDQQTELVPNPVRPVTHQQFLDEMAPNGKFEFLDKLGIAHKAEVELRAGPDGTLPAFYLTLDVNTDSETLGGISKVLGDALLQGTAEARVVIPFGETTSDAMFGVTLSIPEGTNIRDLHAAISEIVEGYDTRFSRDTFGIDRIGDQIVIMDERSGLSQYDDDMAIDFVEMIRKDMEHLDVRPNGFFVQAYKYAHQDFYDGDMPADVEPFKGGLNELEAQNSTAQANRAEKGTKRLPSSGGASDLQRSAIRDLYQRSEMGERALRKTKPSEFRVRAYERPGSAVDPLVAESASAEGRMAIENEIANTPKGMIPIYGNMSDVAVKAVMDAMKFGIGTGISPEIGAQYSKQRVEGLPGAPKGRMTDYDGNITEGLGKRLIRFLDSPDKWGELKSYLSDHGRVGRYSMIHGWQPLEDTSKAYAKKLGRAVLADESAYGAAMTLLDRSKMHFMEMVKTGPVNLVEGYMSVSREGFVTDRGESYRGLAEIHDLLEPSQNDTVEQDADEYRSARRALALLPYGEAAQAELDRTEGGKGLTKERLQMLKDDVAKASSFPGYVVDLSDSDSVLEVRTDLKNYIQSKDSDPRFENILKYDRAMSAVEAYQREFMVDTGLLSRDSEQYRRWSSDSAYIPWTHAEDAAGLESYIPKTVLAKYRATSKATVERKLTGSSRLLKIPLLERVHANAYRIMTDGLSNVVRTRTAGELRALELWEDVKPNTSGDNVIRYLDKGEEVWGRTSDVLLANSLASTSHVFNLSPIVESALFGPARIMREFITRAPGFIARQSTRDPLSAFQTTGAYDNSFSGLADAFDGFFSNFTDFEAYQRAQDLGISPEYDYRNDVNHLRASIKKAQREMGLTEGKSYLRTIWDRAGMLSKMQESAIRLDVYDKVFKATGNEAEARFQALEVINFGRRGANPTLSLLMATIPFFNARLQGLDLIYRSNVSGEYNALDAEMSPDQVRHRAWTRGLVLSSITFAYWAAHMMGDEEEYLENTEDAVREDNWLVPIPGTNHQLKAPIPFEVGVLFKAIPELFLNAMAKGNVEGVGESLKRMGSESADIDLVPQFLAPLLEAARNKNAWGTPIVSSFMERGLESRDRYTQRTTMLARLLGKGPVSPLQMEHILQNYFPGVGLYGFAIADALARKVAGEPIVGTRSDFGDPTNYPLVRDLTTDRTGGLQEDFYELQGRVEEAMGSMNKLREEGRIDEFRARREAGLGLLSVKRQVDSLKQWMKEWRDEREKVTLNTAISASDRRERLDMLNSIRDRRLAIVPVLKDMAAGRR